VDQTHYCYVAASLVRRRLIGQGQIITHFLFSLPWRSVWPDKQAADLLLACWENSFQFN